MEEKLNRSALSVAGENDTYELEEGEWIPDDDFGSANSSRSIIDEGAYYM